MDSLPIETRNHIFNYLDYVELFLLSRTYSMFASINNPCKMNDVALYSAECGNIGILKYAIFHNCNPTLAISAMAAEKGHCDYVKYLKDNRCPVDNMTSVYAVKGKNKKMLEMFDIDSNDKLFFEEVFCTNDYVFVRYILDTYKCDVKITRTDCTDLCIFKLLFERNILTDFPHYSNFYLNTLSKAKRLDTLIWVWEKMHSETLPSHKNAILIETIKTCDIAYLETVLDNTILFPVEADVRNTSTFTFSSAFMKLINETKPVAQVLEMLEWLITAAGIPKNTYHLPKSPRYEIYMWLVNKNIDVDNDTLSCIMHNCVMENNVEAIEYFKTNYKIMFLQKCMYSGLQSGGIKHVEWAIDNGFQICDDKIEQLFEMAISSKNTETVQFLFDHSKHCVITNNTIIHLINIACKHDNLEILKYVYRLFNYKFIWDDDLLVSHAIETGNINIVKWLCENDCPKSCIYIYDSCKNLYENYIKITHHIAKYDDDVMLHTLCELGFSLSMSLKTDLKNLFAARCYIYIMENLHGINFENNGPYTNDYSEYEGYIFNVESGFKEVFTPTIEALNNNYVCNHTYCRTKCDNIRCLEKGMLMIREYENK